MMVADELSLDITMTHKAHINLLGHAQCSILWGHTRYLHVIISTLSRASCSVPICTVDVCTEYQFSVSSFLSLYTSYHQLERSAANDGDTLHEHDER